MMRRAMLAADRALTVPLAQAAGLVPFDVPLRAAGQSAIRSAITKAGGPLRASSRDTGTHDARHIGLPAAINRELVLAQAFFGARYPTYVDRGALARLGEAVQEADRRATEKAAATKKRVF